MGRSKLKTKVRQEKPIERGTEESNKKIPIDNLPEKFLWMRVKGGTKIRNVLGYALKEFPTYNSVVWTGNGHSITKVITCAEIFKRKYENLHQVNKICYASLENLKKDLGTKNHQIPEIYILLTKDIKNKTELGYQAPGDCGKFSEKEKTTEPKTNVTIESADNIFCIDKQSSSMEKDKKRKNMNKLKKNMGPPLKKNKIS